MREYTVHVASAFKDDRVPTLGNPAGLVIFDHLPSPATMADIAARAKLPITTFVAPVPGRRTDFTTRWYDSKGRECHICGHATVTAAASLLHEFPDLEGETFRFHANPDCFSGREVFLTTYSEQGRIGIDLPAGTLGERTDPDLWHTIARALNIATADIESVAFATDMRDYVVAVRDTDALLRIEPDIDMLTDMAESGPYMHEGMMVSAPGDDDEFDLQVRVFLPVIAINEDIACGSGNCSIVPFWHNKGLKPRNDGTYRAVFPYPDGAQGVYGGVQHVGYDAEQGRVIIYSLAELQRAKRMAFEEA